jgi:two-component system sensor histidine kinase DesK
VVLVTARPDPLEVALVVAADICFAALLVIGARMRDDDPRRRGWLVVGINLAITVIALVATTRESSADWLGLFYYASTSASVVAPAQRAAALMGTAGFTGASALLVAGSDPVAAIIQGVSITVIGLILLSAIEVRRTNAELVEARGALAALVVAEERSRIGRDLHDTLGHSLSVIALKSELAARLVPSDPGRAQEEMGDVQRVARESLSAVRETVSGYRQPTLDRELQGARTALEAAGIDGVVGPVPDGLPPNVDVVLAWAVREGVTNIIRHSSAHRADIHVTRTSDAVHAEITDDGVGVSGEGMPARSRTHAATESAEAPGSGLVGLNYRVRAAGGRIETGQSRSGGFRLLVQLPLRVVT